MVQEVKNVIGLFPDLRDSFDRDELPLSFIRQRHHRQRLLEPGSLAAAVHRRSVSYGTALIVWIGHVRIMITLKSILVATDFSEPADAALTYGRALAQNFNATLHLLHVVGDLSRIAYGADGYVTALPDIQREVEDAAGKQLDDLLVDNDERPLVTRRVIITSNAPALAVVEYAGREHIDLIVTGTHGRGAVGHLLMGSVAERVVRTAPCPVLTVRHPEHEFVVPDALVAVAKA